MLSPSTNAYRLLSRYRLKLSEKTLAIEAVFIGPVSVFAPTLISGIYHVHMAGLYSARSLRYRRQNSYEAAAD